MEFEHNSEITPDLVAEAAASRAGFRAFLDHAARVSQPEDGGPKILMACAALSRSEWLDGELRVEVEGDELGSRLGLLIDAGFRERVFPVVELNVPFDEFVRAVRLAPHLIAPLVVRDNEPTKIVLMTRHRSEHPTTRMNAVREDVHTKPTVVRMTAVRPEAIPENRRDDDE
jgi:hypothetical protein